VGLVAGSCAGGEAITVVLVTPNGALVPIILLPVVGLATVLSTPAPVFLAQFTGLSAGLLITILVLRFGEKAPADIHRMLVPVPTVPVTADLAAVFVLCVTGTIAAPLVENVLLVDVLLDDVSVLAVTGGCVAAIGS
jgi:hypothetical protein